jgi:hypothetical protein
MKKRSLKEWRDLIRIKGRGGNRNCSATCPICHITYDVQALSGTSARELAVGKVASHSTRVHVDALADWD